MEPMNRKSSSVAPGLWHAPVLLGSRAAGVRGCVHLLGPQHLAVSAVTAHFRSSQQDLEAEVTLDLLAHFLKRIPEELLDLAAAQADDVRVLLLQARFVIMLIAVMMHQIQLVHQAA